MTARATAAAGEFPFTVADFKRIAAMLYEDAGIALPENKTTLVYSRLAKRLRSLGLESFQTYCDLVAGPSGAEERSHMLAALTTNVTRFFREPHHFDHLRSELLPPLLREAERGNPVRIWSAACSTGEEPYSIGMTILGLLPGAASLDVRVLATDIDPNVLATARAGRYGADSVAPVPTPLRRWMARADTLWEVGPELRQLIAFNPLNLVGPWPMRRQFDAIFCRNVVIYFDEKTQSKIWQRFAPLIATDGMLYIGHSERVAGPALSLFDGVGITAYRRNGAAA